MPHDNQVPPSASHEPQTSSPKPLRFGLALGLERIGLISMRFPALIAVLALVVAFASGIGVSRIKVDDSLSQLFRADTPEFRQYEEQTKRFPSSEFDVLIVVEGDKLLDREPLEKLRNLAISLQLVGEEDPNAKPDIRGIISLFSARVVPEGGGTPTPLVPDILPEGAAYDDLVKQIKSNDIIRGKLLANDGKLALIVLALEPEKVAQSAHLRRIISAIRETITRELADTGLKVTLTGVPVMQLEIRNAIERDRIIYNAVGFGFGCLIAIIFFRRVSFMITAAAPPLIAILFGLGALGWFDFRLNIFLNVMTPLIMVISFADSMQLTFAARDRLIAGDDRFTAFRSAIRVVGPACVLTHGTACLSFIALQFTDSDLIKTFGQAGLIATLVALVTVLTLVPLFGIFLVRRESSFAAQASQGDGGIRWLRIACGWIAGRMVDRAVFYTFLSIAIVAGLGLIYYNLEPRYRLADQVPDHGEAVGAGERLDDQLRGANPINVMIEFPEGTSLYAPETLQIIAQVHTIVEQQPNIGNVWSVDTLRRWLAEKAGKTDVATLKQYVDILPKPLVRRFLSEKQDAVVIAGRVGDFDASRLRPIVSGLDQVLDTVRKEHPQYRISVTSLSAIAARNSADMIGKLSRGLTIEVIFVAAFIGLAFRSVFALIASILPAVFPIVIAGALLWWLGYGLQFASAVALIVSLGLGLSATIHFLNRLLQEERPDEEFGMGVERATTLVGPALILTSMVLSCSLVVTVFSALPSLRLFGWLSALAMILAVIADLTVLRPIVVVLHRIQTKINPGKR